jgi:hypothetical protein
LLTRANTDNGSLSGVHNIGLFGAASNYRQAPSKPSGANQPGFSAAHVPLPHVRRHGMTINYQFGDAHGATIWARVAALQPEHGAIVCDVLAAGDFLGRGSAVASQEFATVLGHNFQVIYERADAHGQRVQTAGSNIATTDRAVGFSWA